MLKKNGYQESKALIVKFLRELLAIPACVSHNIPVQEIRININLPYVEGTSEKLWHILIPYKIRFTFHTESTLRKLLCKRKYRVATEDKKKYSL